MKIKFKSFIAILLVFISVFVSFTANYSVVNAVAINEIDTILPDDYSNIMENYSPTVYGTLRTSFLKKMDNGNYQVVCYADKLYILTYNSDFDLKESKSLDLELPKYGGVYLGEIYNYVVCGQNRNSNQEKGGEVYRIIKYDKNFNKIDSLSLYSDETYTIAPFDSGNVSIDEFGNELTVYTSRLRHDGHQSNLSIRINTDNMTIINPYELSAFPSMHASHSFREIVRYDNEDPVYVDLSDGNPKRSVYLQSVYGDASLMDISGDYGDNRTFAELSGLEISSTNYLVVGTYLNNLMNNVFISSFDKTSGNVEKQWLTASSPISTEAVGNPRIVKVNDNTFVVMWMSGINIEYVLVDGCGKIISNLKTFNFQKLSDCQPIYDNGKVIWINVYDGVLSFVQINDLDASGTYKADVNYKESEDAWDGTADTSWYNSSKSKFNLTTPEQLAGLSKLVNEGNSFYGKTVNLLNDIYLNAKSPIIEFEYDNEWIPIAEEQYDDDVCFDGVFNGNNHHIYNMYVSNRYDGGLFGVIGDNGIVKAITVSQGFCNSHGSIASCNNGVIMFCFNRSNIEGFGSQTGSVGGICDLNYNLIYGCKNYGSVYGDSVGGIVGRNFDSGTVNCCANLGWVQGRDYVAGIVYLNHGWIYNCYNTGIVSGAGDGFNSAGWLGGIVYESNTYPSRDIYGCYFAGIFEKLSDYAVARPIGTSDATDCYYLSENDDSQSNDSVSYAEMSSQSFLNKINSTKIPTQWLQDTIGINDGLPITVADYNIYNNTYKMQPEIWISYSGDLNELELNDGTFNLHYSLYYCDEAPTVSLSNPDIAGIKYSTDNKSGTVTLNLKKVGNTDIVLRFKETENNCETVFRINITIVNTTSPGDVNADCEINAKDRMTLTRYLAKWSGYEDIDMTAADVNQDGIVNAKDRMILTRHLAKWQGYETLPFDK